MIKAVNSLLPRGKSSKLAVKPATADDFFIELAQPHKTFRPGEEVAGQIILVLGQSTVGLRLTLSLQGAVKCSSTSPLRSDKRQSLFDHAVVLYGRPGANEQGLSSGEHRFPFIVKIPKKNVYTSIKFEKGQISYHLESKLFLAEELIDVSKMSLSIIKPINLLTLPEAHPKVLTFKNISSRKTLKATVSTTSSLNSGMSLDSTGSLNNDSVRVKVSMPYIGYLKGETVPVKLNIKHYKHISNVNGIIVTLIRVCKLDLGKDYEFESYRKDLCQSIVPLVLDQKNFGDISTSLRIPPDCFPTIISPSLSFQYFIEVLVNLSSSSSSNRHTPPKSQFSSMNSASSLSLPGFELKDMDIEFTDKIKPMINVDKLKKMKNVLTITNEVVIGTERRPVSNLRSRSPLETPNYDEMMMSEKFINQSQSKGTLPTLEELDLPTIPPAMSLAASYAETIQQDHNKRRGHSGELLCLPTNSNSTNRDADTINQSSVLGQTAMIPPSSNFTFTPLPHIEVPSTIDEKERIRLQEEMRTQALVPSEPPAVIITPQNEIFPPIYQLPDLLTTDGPNNEDEQNKDSEEHILPKYTKDANVFETPDSDDHRQSDD